MQTYHNGIWNVQFLNTFCSYFMNSYIPNIKFIPFNISEVAHWRAGEFWNIQFELNGKFALQIINLN